MGQSRLFLLILGTCGIFLLCTTSLGFKTQERSVAQECKSLIHLADSRVQPLGEMDVNLSDHETLTIQNRELNVTGRIVAEDDAAIVVRNAKLIISPTTSNGISMVLKGRARFLVMNSTIIFDHAVSECQIIVRDEAAANIIESILTGWGYVIGQDVSKVYVEKSSIHNGAISTHLPGVACYGASSIQVENSTIDGIYVWEKSTASINGSNVTTLGTASDWFDKTEIHITSSKLDVLVTFGGAATFRISNSTTEHIACFNYNSYAFIEGSSIPAIQATGNATVVFVDSMVGKISVEGDARILAGWYLPVVGLVTVPYLWVPLMQAGSLMMVVAGMAAVSYGMYRKKRAVRESV